MNLPIEHVNLNLERHALDELSNEAKRALEATLGPEVLGARLQALEHSNAEILESHPPELMARAIEARLRTVRARAEIDATRTRRLRFAAAGFSVAAVLAAILLIVFWPGNSTSPQPTDQAVAQNTTPPDIIRHKSGDMRLLVYRDTPRGPERLEQGDTAFTNDVLQLRYILPERQYGFIFSMDGRGSLTPHFPQRPTDNATLEAGTHALKASYTLDDAPDFERFVLITSKDPLDLESIRAQASQLARDPESARNQPLVLPEHIHQLSFLVRKP